MRHIERSQPLQEFTDYVNRNKPSNWNDFTKQHSIYEVVRLQLEEDQNGLSGYTELPLRNETHIDHFLKKDMFPKNMFDWYNYVVDDHNGNYGADYKDGHIHTEDDNLKLISPVKEEPQHFFTYQVSGKMIAVDGLSDKEKGRANFTIDSFNLNHLLLVKKRAEVFSLIDSYKKGGLEDIDIITVFKEIGLTSFVEYSLTVLRS